MICATLALMPEGKAMNNYSSFGLAIAILVLAVAFAVANKRYKVVNQSTFIALLVLPLLVLGVTSGAIQEFTAPGGVGAKFRDFARDKVSKSALKSPSAYELASLIAKNQPEPNSSYFDNLVDGQPIFLTLALGNTYYTVQGLIDWINVIMQKDKDLLVVFLDRNNKFLAMADPYKLLLSLHDQAKGQNLIDAIKGGVALPKMPENELVFESLQEDTSNAQALQTMVKNNLRAMVVVDKDNRPKFIAERDKIVAQLVTELAAASDQ
jgi:hypothetical protein